VAIIGILAAIAIPAYQDYVIRSQVSEGLAMASATKASVAEFFADRGEWPATEADLGIDTPPVGKYVTGITVTNGIITITYGAQANGAIDGETLALTPFATENLDIVWQCGDRDISGDVSFTTAFAESVVPADGGTILGKYRPSNCRG
jgi:type IV pilus assembly protein PilA